MNVEEGSSLPGERGLRGVDPCRNTVGEKSGSSDVPRSSSTPIQKRHPEVEGILRYLDPDTPQGLRTESRLTPGVCTRYTGHVAEKFTT